MMFMLSRYLCYCNFRGVGLRLQLLNRLLSKFFSFITQYRRRLHNIVCRNTKAGRRGNLLNMDPFVRRSSQSLLFCNIIGWVEVKIRS